MVWNGFQLHGDVGERLELPNIVLGQEAYASGVRQTLLTEFLPLDQTGAGRVAEVSRSKTESEAEGESASPSDIEDGQGDEA